MRSTKKLFLCCTTQALAFASFSDPVIADVVEARSLSFGSIAIISNNSQEFVRISHTGNVSTSTHVMVVTPPITGEFILSNFPANQRLSISGQAILPSSISSQYSSEQFSLTDVDVPSAIFSDTSGSAILPIGGTLSTSGSGSNSYIDTDYTIRYQISINY